MTPTTTATGVGVAQREKAPTKQMNVVMLNFMPVKMRRQRMNELAVKHDAPLSASDVSEQKRSIQKVMKAVMIKDVHYGIIPGTKKPTLYKPGSEAILSMFRIAVIPDVVDLSDTDVARVRVFANGQTPDGTIVGCGVGECSSNEEKYKWRGAVCDEEFDDAPDNRKRVKYSKWQGKVSKKKQIRTEPADIANTVLKMAKKRAQIDLTLTATGASDTFDQDLEDLPTEIVEAFTEGEPSGKPFTEPPKAKPQTGEKLASEGQTKMLWAKLKNQDITEAAFCERIGVKDLASVPRDKVTEYAKGIDGGEFNG